MATLIAIEGIDGSGKGTQARRLDERLNDAGVSTAVLSFPRYDETFFGRAVADFLNGRFGALDEVNPFLASLLYAGDRFESRDLLLDAARRNDVVVLDRYVPSNIAHQGAKLTGGDREELIRWIERVEYEVYELPPPDLVLLCDLPASEAQKLIASKRKRTYTDKAADLQEADVRYLENVRAVYRQLAEGDGRWHTINCMAGGNVRPIEEIGEEVWNAVQRRVP